MRLQRKTKTKKNMGYYTHKQINCTLKEETPQGVINMIDAIFHHGDMPEDCPVDRLKYDVFYYALSGYASDYFPLHKDFYHHETFGWILFFNGTLRDYGNQFEQFIEFLKPYVKYGLGADDMYAFSIGEGDNNPRIYKLYEGRIY